MPPQNAVELVPSKSGGETPKNGNLNNNNGQETALLAKLDLSKTEEEVEPTKATIVIPPDGGFGWVVMVSHALNLFLILHSPLTSTYQFASFCCNIIVDGIVFSSGFFITPIMGDLGASKASVALAGSLLSGFYLIVGPIVSGKSQMKKKMSERNA